jgi:hypothetical protein
MLVFFSLSLGKRPVYLLPVYPALALLTALWLVKYDGIVGARSYYYRGVALFAAFTGAVLLLVVIGELWNHNPTILFSPIASLLKPKDRANFALVSGELAAFGRPLAVAALASALLWLSLARCFWSHRMLAAAPRLVLIALVFSFVASGLVMPKIAETKSYRPFMLEVNQLVGRDHQLYLYRNSFNSDQVVFYRGEPLEVLNPAPDETAANIGAGNAYMIMAERDWLELKRFNENLPAPLLKSIGTGPEGNAPLVLVRMAEPR